MLVVNFDKLTVGIFNGRVVLGRLVYLKLFFAYLVYENTLYELHGKAGFSDLVGVSKTYFGVHCELEVCLHLVWNSI